MTTLTIIRGLPGSGKSTLARKLQTASWGGSMHLVDNESRWYEADHFFEDDDGVYAFDAALLREAHQWCYANVLRELRNGKDVIVSNTFTKVWEMLNYIQIGEIVPNVEVKILEVKTQFRTVHGVPEGKIAQMRARWEAVPAELGVSVEVVYPVTDETLAVYDNERLVSKFDKETL